MHRINKIFFHDEAITIFSEETFVEFLTSRRSYKRIFADQPLDPAIIEKIVNIAQWAPSAHNAQPWRFVAVIDPDRKQRLVSELSARFREDLVNDGMPAKEIEVRVQHSIHTFSAAPVLIVVCGWTEDTLDEYPDAIRQLAERIMYTQSVANGTCYLLLAAHACGLASCWYCAPLFAKDVVREVLDLPLTMDPLAFVTLGYPRGKASKAPLRKNVGEILTIL
ncbi:MAG TPA: nitroreductase family protein [Candidatus Lokiarchaeia archaeon]|nr:nitroreductase family protein [Candidatus Lokiarchaeia archaeon]